MLTIIQLSLFMHLQFNAIYHYEHRNACFSVLLISKSYSYNKKYKNINLMAEHKRKRREAHPAARKGEEILIQKSQINDPKLDDDTQKILDSIVLSIRNSPPAKPRRKYQKGETSEKDSNTEKSATSACLSGSRVSTLSLTTNYNNFTSRTNTITNISNSRNSVIGDNESTTMDYDRKSLSFYMNQQTHSQLSRLVDENKSCCLSQQTNQNHSNNESQVTKDKLTTSITANLQQFFAKKPLRDRPKPKVSSLATKKRIVQGMVPSSCNIKCIDLQSQQIIQVQVHDNDKKKAQLELIMRYDQKNSIKQQTNVNMNHQSPTNEFNVGDNPEDKSLQINQCLLNDIDVPLNQCLTIPEEAESRQESHKLNESTNEEQK